LAFLQNHRGAIGAFDFFTEPTLMFQVLYGFFVIEHVRGKPCFSCRMAGLSFFYKQGGSSNSCPHDRKSGHFDCFPQDLRIREFPSSEAKSSTSASRSLIQPGRILRSGEDCLPKINDAIRTGGAACAPASIRLLTRIWIYCATASNEVLS
jgi:hypothetical protein